MAGHAVRKTYLQGVVILTFVDLLDEFFLVADLRVVLRDAAEELFLQTVVRFGTVGRQRVEPDHCIDLPVVIDRPQRRTGELKTVQLMAVIQPLDGKHITVGEKL